MRPVRRSISSRVAEVEERVCGPFRVVEDGVDDLQLRDAPPRHLGQPRLALDEVGRVLIRDPTIAGAEQAEEVGPAAADFVEAGGQDLALGLALIGDAPAQVDLGPGHAALLAQFVELRKDSLDQFLPLLVHVAEGGGDKHANQAFAGVGLVLLGHGRGCAV
jgi:hypothetical protein